MVKPGAKPDGNACKSLTGQEKDGLPDPTHSPNLAHTWTAQTPRERDISADGYQRRAHTAGSRHSDTGRTQGTPPAGTGSTVPMLPEHGGLPQPQQHSTVFPLPPYNSSGQAQYREEDLKPLVLLQSQ